MEILDLLADEPSLKPDLDLLFVQMFVKSKKLAESEMSSRSDVAELTWAEVFDDEYCLIVDC
jgi:hypothetical protein